MRSNKTQEKSIGEAKAHFAECIREAEGGGSIVLTRHGRPVARIEPLEDAVDAAPKVAEPVMEYEEEAQGSFRSVDARKAALRRLLEDEIWPNVPKKLRGQGISKREREEILGYGEEGV